MNGKNEINTGLYCGIEVEILAHMNHCALVRYGSREFIVDTQDLIVKLSFARAA